MRVVALLLPSLADALFCTVLLGVALGLQGAALGPDGDIGWSLRIGGETLTHGLPRREFLLATTSGQPVVYWQWLAQLAYTLAYRIAGLNGVVALVGLVVAATSAGLYLALRRRRVPLVAALGLAVVGIGLISITRNSRRQLFSLLLTLWWSEELWRYWRDGQARRLWSFPIVAALWANLHGGFLGGLLLLGTATGVAWLAPTRRGRADPRHLVLALGGSLLATLATPWGPELYSHTLRYLRNPLI